MKLKLATRLSAFFLVAMAVILLCFSAALYFATRLYLRREVDERLQITLDVLEASIDIEPEGMEWEPVDRRLNVGTDRGDDQVRWAVFDRGGAVVGQSLNAEAARFPPPEAWRELPRLPLDATCVLELDSWRLAGRTLRLKELLNPESARDDSDAVEDDVQHEELLIVAGLSPAPVEASLRWLLLALVVATGVVWTLCGLFGRRLVLWAMSPVREIASAAKNLSPGDPGWRLPSPGTADELDDLAEAFNQLLARLRDAFDRQRRFTGDASHQLRTPLAGILGQLDVALLRDRSPQDYRHSLALARDEARRLRGIVDSLLLLARTEAGPPANTTCLELRGWLRDHMSRWTDHQRHSDLHFDIGACGETWVRAEPELLAQAFHNLIDNALKYSEPGSPVRVELSCSSDTAKVTVSDCGRGVAADDLAQLFQPFYRADAARLAGLPGCGLGLAVASHIVEAFAGSISVDSKVGEGSRFTMRLPLVRVDENDLCTA
ncbi:MAG TPA: HAMP domain-containing sensor histidine kinase [Pirellulales bacterium]|nr:HAMP domain-containing sensor histidine kinase [Pirellulales bacterium]